MSVMPSDSIYGNIDPEDGRLPYGNKPLTESMLTYISVVTNLWNVK